MDELLDALRTVAAGGSVVDPQVVRRWSGGRSRGDAALGRLTPREQEVLAEMAADTNNARIAATLVHHQRAVEKHINSIFAKLGLAEEPDYHRRVAGGAALPRAAVGRHHNATGGSHPTVLWWLRRRGRPGRAAPFPVMIPPQKTSGSSSSTASPHTTSKGCAPSSPTTGPCTADRPACRRAAPASTSCSATSGRCARPGRSRTWSRRATASSSAGTNSCEQQSFFGVPGRGIRQVFAAIFIHRVVDGRVAETWRCADDLGRLLQLGARIGAP